MDSAAGKKAEMPVVAFLGRAPALTVGADRGFGVGDRSLDEGVDGIDQIIVRPIRLIGKRPHAGRVKQ